MILTGGALTSCGQNDAALQVFAASSLAGAFTELAETFEEDHPDTEIRLNFAGSSSLREQIEDGATVDVFASANLAIVGQLLESGALNNKPRQLVANTIVLAVPASNPGQVSAPGDLQSDDLAIGACAAQVPCGELADQAVEALGYDVAFDTREPDVRSLAARLEDEELDAGFVYRSDVVGSDGALIIAWDGSIDRTIYPIVAVDPESDRAGAFVDFATGPDGLAILEQWGFERP